MYTLTPHHQIRIKDVENLLGISNSGAHKKIQLAKAALGKQKHQILSVQEFCAYYDVTLP